MDISGYEMKFTICFVISGEKSLVIYRSQEPNFHKWNGLGGKIEGSETPRENIIREMSEEAELDLAKAEKLIFSGIVTWEGTRKNQEKIPNRGMYAYLAYFPPSVIFPDRKTREGLLAWKEISWLCDKKNTEVTENIPYFLPQMLSGNPPHNYHCTYVFGTLVKFEEKPLSQDR